MKKRSNLSDKPNPFREQAEKKWNSDHEITQSNHVPGTDPDRLIHELEVHQIEMEMQNEELVRIRGELETLLERFTDLYDFAPVGYLTLTRNGTIDQVNLAGAKLLGKERATLIKLKMNSFIADEFKPAYSDFIEAVFTHGEPQYCDVRFLRDSELPVWVHLEGSKDLQHPEFCRVVAVDITKLKQTEQTLQESVVFNEMLLQTVPFGLDIVDEQGKLLYLNPTMETMAGIKGVGNFCWEVYRDDNQQCADCPLINPPPKGKVSVIESSGVLGSRHFEISHTEIVYNGQPAILEVFYDITERKEMEQKIFNSREMLQSVLNTIPEFVFWKDRHSNYLGANLLFAQSAGLADVADIVGKTDFDLEWSKSAENYQADDQLVMETQTPRLNYEEEQVRSDGSIRWLRTSKTPLFDANGQVMGVLGVYADITEQKQAEAEHAGLEARLHQAQKMESVGRLAGGVAHDFNNMLSVILGHSELLLDKMETTHPLYTSLTEIHKAGRRSADITRQLLAFARKQIISPRVLDIDKTIENMLSMIRQLIGEDIELFWHPTTELKFVHMDAIQIDQILANLCINSRDAIEGVGKITIETSRRTLDSEFCKKNKGFIPGDYIVLAISDDGSGIDSEIIENIFEPFFTTKEVGQGTGMGLATVYGIVKQNDGFIKVYSEVNVGTTIKIFLPREGGNQSKQSRQVSTEIPRGSGETILLVEDEPAIRKLGQELLENLGYKVLVADSPNAAVEINRTYTGVIHMLLTDVIMPEMNGRDLAAEIQMQSPQIKILFMSGYSTEIIAQRGMLTKDRQLIQKPFTRHELAFKIKSVLEGD